MQIIIEISEDDYKEVKEETYSGIQIENRVFSAIANGTPLPKGHGRLIDKDHVIARLEAASKFLAERMQMLSMKDFHMG